MKNLEITERKGVEFPFPAAYHKFALPVWGGVSGELSIKV